MGARKHAHACVQVCVGLGLLPLRSNPPPALPLPIPIVCSGRQGMVCHPSTCTLTRSHVSWEWWRVSTGHDPLRRRGNTLKLLDDASAAAELREPTAVHVHARIVIAHV